MVDPRGSGSPSGDTKEWLLSIAEALCGAGSPQSQIEPLFPSSCRRRTPSSATLRDTLDALRSGLFPGYFGAGDSPQDDLCRQTSAALERASDELPNQIERGFSLAGNTPSESSDRGRRITQEFLTRLPRLQRVLATDVQAAFEGDPAATCREETIVCYPGLLAITYYRLAHELHLLGVPLVPRMITELGHSLTGIDIHPAARIGERFFIDHGTGVVIGETTVIGRGVRMYQGVTLGALSFPADEHGHPVKGGARHPIVEDDVVIYAGATILGRVTIGRGSIIGGGVWLTHSVPPATSLSLSKDNGNSACPRNPD